jgi:two-component system, NarL family, nitrate/nitrite response regulator NarL
MTLTHLCFSSRANQLLRWQQAFPEGRVLATPERLQSSIRGRTIIWLHADSLPQGTTLQDTIGRLIAQEKVHRVVVISCVPTVQETSLVLASGATGYCHALATPELFRKISSVVSNGGFWVGSDFLSQLASSVSRVLTPAQPNWQPSALGQLSAREQEVALQVRGGASNKEIAESLGITERTVKAHLGAIFQKLEIRDRLQLILLLTRDPS